MPAIFLITYTEIKFLIASFIEKVLVVLSLVMWPRRIPKTSGSTMDYNTCNGGKQISAVLFIPNLIWLSHLPTFLSCYKGVNAKTRQWVAHDKVCFQKNCISFILKCILFQRKINYIECIEIHLRKGDNSFWAKFTLKMTYFFSLRQVKSILSLLNDFLKNSNSNWLQIIERENIYFKGYHGINIYHLELVSFLTYMW